METISSSDQIRFEVMNTEELRESFLIENLFKPGELKLVYSDVERIIVGSAVPVNSPLELSSGKDVATEYFAQSREIGVINIGGDGKIIVDETEYPMVKLDSLYIGRGSKKITFNSEKGDNPARFYIVSTLAHKEYPTSHAPISQAEPVKLGSVKESNKRTIYKYIHADGIKSCQLVMGCTLLEEGCVWNTMPAHTHGRRSEVYMYFDLDEDAVVFHLIGSPQETRHIVMKNGQVSVTPYWSIHAGCGTSNYAFVWAMGGENQDYTDSEVIPVPDLM